MCASPEEALSFVFFLPVGGNKTGVCFFFFKRIFGKKWGSSSDVEFEQKGEIGGKEAVRQ